VAEKSIEFKNITKIYNAALEKKPVTAVKDLSFSVESGVLTGFVGPNGAGKTTSIKMTLGLVTPTKGEITLMGKKAGTPESRKDIAYVSEQPYFYEHLSAEETLAFVCEMKGISVQDRKSEIDRVLDRVELIHRRNAKVKSFSKGMQQRLNMAQALLGNPKLIIMDEPMSGLDPLGRRLFRSIFKDLKENGTTVFFSTHIIEDIQSLCDRVVVLSKGQLKYQGDIKKLIDDSKIGTEFLISENDSPTVVNFLDKQNVQYETTNERNLLVTFDNSESDNFVKFLADNSIIPLSIQPIRKSLEDILYDKKEEK